MPAPSSGSGRLQVKKSELVWLDPDGRRRGTANTIATALGVHGTSSSKCTSGWRTRRMAGPAVLAFRPRSVTTEGKCKLRALCSSLTPN